MSEKSRRKAPVSTHPAFPAIVALWFAALLGLGSMVLPIELFENLSVASGLSSLVATAEPPLGMTARIAIAIAASSLGCVLGLAIARQVARSQSSPQAQRSVARAGQAAAKRPISAHDELGEGGLDAEDDDDFAPRGPIPGRRRALSVTDDSARSEFLAHVPLPGDELEVPAESDTAEAEPLDLADFDAAEPEVAELEAEPESEIAPQDDAAFGSASLSAPPIPGAMPFRAPERPAPAAFEPAEELATDELAKADPIASPVKVERPIGELAIVELVDRFARALERRRVAAEAAAAEAEEDAGVVVDVTFAFPAKNQPASGAAVSVEPPIPVVPAALRPLGFETFGEADEDDDEEAEIPALNLSLGSRPFAAPASSAEVADELDEEAGEESETSYPSLLAMKGPFGLPREPVRVEEDDDDADGLVEPVVVFPGQATRRAVPAPDGPTRDAGLAGPMAGARPFDAPAARAEAVMAGAVSPASPAPTGNAADTERALREALEKLQKMSGAA